MSNDNSAINDLVTKHAEEFKEKEDTGGNQEKEKTGDDGQGGKEPTEEEKEAAAKLAAAETEKTANAEKIKSEATAELLKKFNVESLEELEAKLKENDKKPLSKEEQEKADEVYEAKLRAYAVEKGVAKLEDFDQLKTLKSKQDADLIFENYLKDWKEENPDVKVEGDVTEADIIKAAKDDFEKEYRLNSTNDKIKQKGIERLAKEAKELRSPYESSYNDAKEQFDTENELRNNFPKFVKGIEKVAEELVPTKTEWFKGKDGDEELPAIEVTLSDEDRKEVLDKITKRLQKPENYELWKEGKLEDLKEGISEYVEYLVGKKTKEVGNAKIAEIFLGRGLEKGSKVGAESSFATNQAKAAAHSKTKSSKTDAEQEVLKQFGKK